MQRGLVHDLDALSRKFAPKYMDNWGKRIRLYYRMHFDDMGFSFHPAYHVSDEQMDSPLLLKAMPGVTVLKEVYEYLGAPEINNTDDYVDLLRRVKQEFPELTPAQSVRGPSPDKDGNPQLVSVSLPLGGLAKRFFQGDDGVWYKYWEHEDFSKVLQFANTLYNEHLIARTEFTEKAAAALGQHDDQDLLRAETGRRQRGRHSQAHGLHQCASAAGREDRRREPALHHASRVHDRAAHEVRDGLPERRRSAAPA